MFESSWASLTFVRDSDDGLGGFLFLPVCLSVVSSVVAEGAPFEGGVLHIHRQRVLHHRKPVAFVLLQEKNFLKNKHPDLYTVST